MKSVQETLKLIKEKISEIPEGMHRNAAEKAFNNAIKQGDDWYFASQTLDWKVSATENTIEQAKQAHQKFVQEYYKNRYPDLNDKTIYELFTKNYIFENDVCYKRITTNTSTPIALENQVEVADVVDTTETIIKAHDNKYMFEYLQTKKDLNETLKFFRNNAGDVKKEIYPGTYFIKESFVFVLTAYGLYSIDKNIYELFRTDRLSKCVNKQGDKGSYYNGRCIETTSYTNYEEGEEKSGNRMQIKNDKLKFHMFKERVIEKPSLEEIDEEMFM